MLFPSAISTVTSVSVDLYTVEGKNKTALPALSVYFVSNRIVVCLSDAPTLVAGRPFDLD